MFSKVPVAVQLLMGRSALMVSTIWMELDAGSSTTKRLPPWEPPRMFRSVPLPWTSSMAPSRSSGSRRVPSSRLMV